MEIRIVTDVKSAEEISNIHMKSFKNFFLTSLGKGFLKSMYKGFLTHKGSHVIGAFDFDGNMTGFIAYSENISDFYHYLIRRHCPALAYHSFVAFLKKPGIFFRILRAFRRPNEAKRNEPYIAISSLCVLPEKEGCGIGSRLLDACLKSVDFSRFSYVKLETDAEENHAVNTFYQKNGFALFSTYTTPENRKMNEYHYVK